jgi:hypothetical protein
MITLDKFLLFLTIEGLSLICILLIPIPIILIFGTERSKEWICDKIMPAIFCIIYFLMAVFIFSLPFIIRSSN